MSRVNNCKACSNARNGVKTRIAVEHTCGANTENTKVEELHDLTCMVCGKEFKVEKPKMCCSGTDCGCMGFPIDPVVCSDECFISLKTKTSKQITV